MRFHVCSFHWLSVCFENFAVRPDPLPRVAEGGVGRTLSARPRPVKTFFGCSNRPPERALFHKCSTTKNFKNLTLDLLSFCEGSLPKLRRDRRIRLKKNQSQCDEPVTIFDAPLAASPWVTKRNPEHQSSRPNDPPVVLKHKAIATVTRVPAMMRQGNSITGNQAGFS